MEFVKDFNNRDQKTWDVDHGTGTSKYAYNVLEDSSQKMESVLKLTQIAKHGIIKDHVTLAIRDIYYLLENVLFQIYHAKQQIQMGNVHHAIQDMSCIKKVVLFFRKLLV